MTKVAVARDLPPSIGLVIVLVTPETTLTITMTDIVLVGTPAYIHLREDIL